MNERCPVRQQSPFGPGADFDFRTRFTNVAMRHWDLFKVSILPPCGALHAGMSKCNKKRCAVGIIFLK